VRDACPGAHMHACIHVIGLGPTCLLLKAFRPAVFVRPIFIDDGSFALINRLMDYDGAFHSLALDL
jgi:hypothetical protein